MIVRPASLARVSLWVVLAALPLALFGCSSSDDDGNGDDDDGEGGAGGAAGSGGAGTGGDLGVCDGTNDCMTCQNCAYAENGPCAAEVDACLADDGCVEINTCITECVEAAGEAAVFSTCYEQCDANKPQGGAAYEAVLGCVRDEECVADCEFM